MSGCYQINNFGEMSTGSFSKKNFLLGHERKCLSHRKLPNNQEVLSFLMYNYKSLGKSLQNSIKIVINEVIAIWSKTKIPVMKNQNGAKKLKNLYQKWIKINKNNTRTKSVTQKTEEKNFKLLSKNLFDIASKNKDIRLTSEQETFFINGRNNKRRSIILFDYEETDSESEQSLEELSRSVSNITISNESRNDSFHSLQRIPSNFEDELPTTSKAEKINLMTPLVTSALDRNNTTPRDATIIMSAVTQSLGIPLEKVNMSPSTIYRHCKENRKNIGKDIKKNFKPTNILTLHWDAKLLPEMTGSKKVERLPVIVTGIDCEQMLGVPKLSDSSAVNQSEVIFELLEDWNLKDRVGALCFDTTSVNTGVGDRPYYFSKS